MRPDDEEFAPDDVDYEEFLELSDEEAERRCQVAMRQYNEWYDSLTFQQRIAYARRTVLKTCKRWRKLRRTFGNDGMNDFWTKHLRERQVRLLQIREWRRTGIEPGKA